MIEKFVASKTKDEQASAAVASDHGGSAADISTGRFIGMTFGILVATFILALSVTELEVVSRTAT